MRLVENLPVHYRRLAIREHGPKTEDELPSGEGTHRIYMNHGRATILEASHKAWFMKDGMSDIMNVMEVQGNQLEK